MATTIDSNGFEVQTAAAKASASESIPGLVGVYSKSQPPPPDKRAKSYLINPRSFIKGGVNKGMPPYLLKEDEWLDSQNMTFDHDRAKGLMPKTSVDTLVADVTNLQPAFLTLSNRLSIFTPPSTVPRDGQDANIDNLLYPGVPVFDHTQGPNPEPPYDPLDPYGYDPTKDGAVEFAQTGFGAPAWTGSLLVSTDSGKPVPVAVTTTQPTVYRFKKSFQVFYLLDDVGGPEDKIVFAVQPPSKTTVVKYNWQTSLTVVPPGSLAEDDEDNYIYLVSASAPIYTPTVGVGFGTLGVPANLVGQDSCSSIAGTLVGFDTPVYSLVAQAVVNPPTTATSVTFNGLFTFI